VEPTALVAYLATFQDLVWVLTKEQQDLLLRLTPGAFDGKPGRVGIHLAQAHALRGTRPTRGSTRRRRERRTRSSSKRRPGTPSSTSFSAWRSRTWPEGGRGPGRGAGVALLPVSQDAYAGAYMQHQLVRIHILTGEPEKALDQLSRSSGFPISFPRGGSGSDPTFDPLRGNPRFEKLEAGGK